MRYGGSAGLRPARSRVVLGSIAAAAMVVLALLGATAVLASSGGNGKGHKGGNSGNAHEHVTICHGAPPNKGFPASHYVRISPSASGVYHGHLRHHDADIIPPFTYGGYTYSQNWDAEGQAIWNNGCVVPASTTTTTTTTAAAATRQRLGLAVEKLERIGATGGFARGPVAATVGDTIFYEILVRNTGNTRLAVTVLDSRCDAGTLVPTTARTLRPGGRGTWFCSHVLTSSDAPAFVNVAVARGYSAAVQSTVSARSRVKAAVTSGVDAAHKTLKRVRHKAAAPKPVTDAASFTG